MTISSFSNSFNISEISFSGVPVAESIENELDYFGLLLGTPRLKEEKNKVYKKRLLKTYVDKSNSTYIGLMNGITRELGLEYFKPITITCLLLGEPVTPKLVITDSEIHLYVDYNEEPELIINRSDPSLPEYFLGGLVDLINTSSSFSAVLNDESYRYFRSDTLLNQTSFIEVAPVSLNNTKTNYLGFSNIVIGSVVFSNRTIFRKEVANVNLVLNPGDFFLDYETGLLTSFDFVTDDSSIQFSYIKEEFQPKASEVIIRSISSITFQQVLFNKIELPNGESTFGTPTKLGSDIINELLSITPIYWGE